MSDIMDLNWDTKDGSDPNRYQQAAIEVTEGAKAVIGLGLGVGGTVGIYKGIKDYRIEKRRNEEDQARADEILDRWKRDRESRRAHKNKVKDKRRDAELSLYDKIKRKLDKDKGEEQKPTGFFRRLNADAADPMEGLELDEGIAPEVIGYGLLGVGAYKAGKGITSAIVKKSLKKRDRLKREHEYAFPKDESANILSKTW